MNLSYINSNYFEGEIGFRVSNLCEIPFSVESVQVRLYTCQDTNYLNSNEPILIQKRIDLGKVVFDGKAIRQVTGNDTIYNISELATVFFKIKYSSQEVETSKKNKCELKISADLITESLKPKIGDIIILIYYIDPRTGDSESMVLKVET